MTHFLEKTMTFPMPQKRDGGLELDIWGRPSETEVLPPLPRLYSLEQTPCDHLTRVFTICGGWRCGICNARLA